MLCGQCEQVQGSASDQAKPATGPGNPVQLVGMEGLLAAVQASSSGDDELDVRAAEPPHNAQASARPLQGTGRVGPATAVDVVCKIDNASSFATSGLPKEFVTFPGMLVLSSSLSFVETTDAATSGISKVVGGKEQCSVPAVSSAGTPTSPSALARRHAVHAERPSNSARCALSAT